MSVIINKSLCTGCGTCVDVCPVEAITLVENKAVVDDDLCIECGACETECPEQAIRPAR